MVNDEDFRGGIHALLQALELLDDNVGKNTEALGLISETFGDIRDILDEMSKSLEKLAKNEKKNEPKL